MKNISQLFEALPVPAFAIDKSHKIIAWNKACEMLTGLLEKDMLGTSNQWKGFYNIKRPCLADIVLDGITNKEELDKLYQIHDNVDFCTEAQRSEGWFFSQDNQLRYLMFEAKPLTDENGNILGAVEVFQDITHHKKLEEELKLSASVFDNTSEGIFITDKNNKIISANKALEKLCGYSIEEIIGQNPKIFASDRHSKSFFTEMWNSLQNLGHWQGEFWNKNKYGEDYLVHSYISTVKLDNEINYIALLTDITEKNKVLEQMDYLAHHDFLTGLPNRVLLEDRVAQGFMRGDRNSTKCAVLFIDLDKFKNINDTLGHDIGDILLKEVAKRFKETLRESDTIARQGGDEFVILLEGIQTELDVAFIAQKIINAISQPFKLGEHDISITCSIGISIYPNDGSSVADLLKHADTAMYFMKSQGRNGYKFYTESMNQNNIETLKIINKLNCNLPDCLDVYYQPQLCSKSNTFYGAEALVRWNDSELGFVSPEKFIPIAEEAGLIKTIGAFVLKEACKIIKQYNIKISVNVSPIQLEDNEFIYIVEELIKDITPCLLTLEITENALIRNFDSTKEKLVKIKELGINLALDDFGTGYSSLSYLHQLPFDYLKIDKSFVQAENNNPIVLAIIQMADTLKLRTVAEGVETSEQLDILQKNGCSVIQGFYYSRPIDKNKFIQFVIENKLDH